MKSMPKSIPEACRGDLPLSVFPGKAHRNLSKSMHMSPEKYDKIHVKNVAESTPEAFRGALSLSLSLSLSSSMAFFVENYAEIL